MDSITVRVPVVVKAKLTEKLRTRLVGELTKLAEQLELEMNQINLDRQHELNEHPDLGRKENLEKLALGAEIMQGHLERQIELKVGDDFREAMNMELLIEDDKVVAIRG